MDAQSASNRYGTQDLFVIDSINYDDGGTTVNLADSLVAFAVSNPSDAISFPNGAQFVSCESLTGLLLDSLEMLGNSSAVCGYLIDSNQHQTFAILTTSDVRQSPETVGAADHLELSLAGVIDREGVNTPDCKVTFAFAQFLPDTANPCAEENLGPLELAAHRAAIGNYSIYSLDSLHPAHCMVPYYWDCYMIWWYPKWPVVWLSDGNATTATLGAYSAPLPAYDVLFDIPTAGPAYASTQTCLAQNYSGDATPVESCIPFMMQRPMRYYDYSCYPFSPSLPGGIGYNKNSLACHCFQVQCVNECKIFNVSAIENDWKIEGRILTLARECTWILRDVIGMDLTINHNVGMGPPNEGPNVPVYHFQKAFYPPVAGADNIGQSTIIVASQAHGDHIDFLYLEQWFMKMTPDKRDILDFKICFSTVHAWPKLHCPATPITLEHSNNDSLGNATWIGPNGYSSNQNYPTLPPLTANMVGNYVCTGIDPSSQCPFTETIFIDMTDTVALNIPSDTLHVTLGSSAALTCSATLSSVAQGAITPTVEWRNSAYVGQGTSITVTPGQTAMYYAQIMNASGACNTSDSILVIVDSCPNPKMMDLSTGRDVSTMSVLSPPDIDPNYALVSTSFGSPNLPLDAYVVQPDGNSAPAPNGSNWIGNDPQCLQAPQPGGGYGYLRKFHLQQSDPSVRLSLALLANDTAIVYLNGYEVLQCSSATATATATITEPSKFNAGENILDIVVRNVPNSTAGFALQAILESCDTIMNLTETDPGILTTEPLASVVLYPNPAQTIIQVTGLPPSLKGTFTLVDAWGRECIQQQSPDFQIEQLPTGLYFVRVKTAVGTKALRFVIQR